MMKWRVKKENRFHVTEHEDVRRSLEVLDSVLAEFDDCIPLLDSPDMSHLSMNALFEGMQSHCEFSEEEDAGIEDSREDDRIEEVPPPVPRRSPTTRLSAEHQNYFTFPIDDVVLDNNSGILSASEQRLITSLSPLGSDCTDIPSEHNEAKVPSLSNRVNRMASLPPKSPKDAPLKPIRTSFKQKNTNSVLSSNNFKNDVISGISNCFSSNEISEDRVRRLDEKFKRVKELLLLNKIKPLEDDPPSFIPPLPLHEVNSLEQQAADKASESVNDAPKDSTQISSDKEIVLEDILTQQGPNSYQKSLGEARNFSSLLAERTSTDSLSDSNMGTKLTDPSSRRNSLSLRTTVEDIPYLLPTDVLGRPQLGMSYSLEEDMSPGIKEICKTSTPRSDVSPNSKFSIKESGLLSSFGSSSGSLGYVSSQSEIDLNSWVEVPDKVPITSFKSMTLPHGVDSFLFYSSQDNSSFLKTNKSEKELRSEPQDGVDKKVKKKDSPFKLSRFSRKDKKKNGPVFSLSK